MWLRVLSHALLLVLCGVLVGCFRPKDKDEAEPVLQAGEKEVLIEVPEYDYWRYFSFSEGRAIAVSNPSSNLDWDLAFCRNYVRTNSGLSGSGRGGAYRTSAEDLSASIPLPGAGEFRMDDEPGVQIVEIIRDKYGNMKGARESLAPVNKVLTFSQYVVQKDETGRWRLVPEMEDGKVKIVERKRKVNGKVETYKDTVFKRLDPISYGMVYKATQDMPPQWTVSRNVFLVRCADGMTFAKIKLMDFTSPETAEGGYPRFRYVYPYGGQ